MSTFESAGYQWRETYFVLFDSLRRPSVDSISKTVSKLSRRFQLKNVTGDDTGMFESLTVVSPEDYAALDISYESGVEVREQGATLAAEMKAGAADAEERAKLARLPRCDARFDILHFEQVINTAAEEETDEMLDPSALLIVLDALVELTKGVGIDPQSGTVM
jgi:hypothetical protein